MLPSALYIVACARLSDSISSGNVLKAKLRRARLGKGGGGGGKNGTLCDQPGLRITENNLALSFSRFILVLLSLFTDAK